MSCVQCNPEEEKRSKWLEVMVVVAAVRQHEFFLIFLCSAVHLPKGEAVDLLRDEEVDLCFYSYGSCASAVIYLCSLATDVFNHYSVLTQGYSPRQKLSLYAYQHDFNSLQLCTLKLLF